MIVTGLRKIESWVVAIAIVANISGALVLLVLVAIMNIDIFSRNILNAPFRGVVEVVIFSLALIVFLQLPDVVRTGRLTRSDGFFNIVKRHKPVAGRYMGAIFDFLGAIFFAIVLWGAVPDLYDAWVNDYFVGEQGLFTFPEWPIKIIIMVGCTVTFLHFIRMGVRYLFPGSDAPNEQFNPTD